MFKKLGFDLAKEEVDAIIKSQPGAIERLLRFVQLQVASYLKNPPPPTKLEVKPPKSQKQVLVMHDAEAEEDPKDKVIEELKETIEIMDLKIKKLEQLLALKDSKLQALYQKGFR